MLLVLPSAKSDQFLQQPTLFVSSVFVRNKFIELGIAGFGNKCHNLFQGLQLEPLNMGTGFTFKTQYLLKQ